MKKILVPVDFSEASRNASAYAASLAQAFGAQLHLIHVYMEPAPVGDIPVSWSVTISQLQRENAARIDQELDSLQAAYGIPVSGDAKLGFTGDTINTEAVDTGADLIVMGMKGTGRSKIIGSTVVTTIRKTKIPVLVIPEGTAFQPPKTITLASDFSETARDASFNPLFWIVEKFHAVVQVVHVRKEEDQSMKSTEIAGKLHLETLLGHLPHTYFTIAHKDVEDGINNFITHHPTDWLVMVAHRHNIFERLFGTSHTKAMSYDTKIPLLVLEDR